MRFREPWLRARLSPRPPTRFEPRSYENQNPLSNQGRENQTFPLKQNNIENVVVDEVHARTYVVMADRVLTDGELYKAIRQALLKRTEPVAKGERLVLEVSAG
jgi:hypothetical protein